MTTFYICRHGQTENNRDKRLSGWIDTPLTGEGVLNAISVAQRLKSIQFDRVIASDLGRAFRTAYLITQELNPSLYIDATAALREVNYGVLANTSHEGLDIAYPKLSPIENAQYVPRDGESLVQMQLRVTTYVYKIADQEDGKTILLVAHDGTVNALYATYTGRNIGVVDAESNNAHDCAIKFEVSGNRITSFSSL